MASEYTPTLYRLRTGWCRVRSQDGVGIPEAMAEFDRWLTAHDAEVERRALPDPDDGCVCAPHSQYAGGGYWEHLPEYEPACPEHSEHLYNPKTGVWELVSEVERRAAERAWEEGSIQTTVAFRTGQNYVLNPYTEEQR